MASEATSSAAGAGAGAEGEVRPLVSIYLLETIKAAQEKNGLRHHDYLRYRQYCTRKLRRLRSGKQIKLTQGRGRRYVQKNVTPDIVTEERHLHLPLFNAERAWSFAMQLKQDDQVEDNPRLRFHLMKRLRRATTWAAQLRDLCRECADERTYLEADAYLAWMQGTFSLEKESWTEAYEAFERSRLIYEQLTKLGSRDQRRMFEQRLEDIQPSLRYCKYNVERSGGATSSTELRAMLNAAEGSDQLQAKLDSLLAEARKTQAETMSEVRWRGHGVPVRSEKLRLAILETQDKASAVQQAESSGAALAVVEERFMELLASCEESLRRAVADVARLSKAGRKAQTAEAHELEAYIRRMKLQAAYDRNLLLVRQALSGAPIGPMGKPMVDNKKAEELAALYARAMRTVADMEALPGLDEDPAEQALLSARRDFLAAFRNRYCATVYFNQAKWAESLALMADAKARATTAKEAFASISDASAATTAADLERLVADIREDMCVAQANAILSANPTRGSLEEALAAGAVSTRSGGAVGVLDRLAKFEAGPFAPIPPPMLAVSCKPLHFDLAVTTLAFPNLSARMKMKKSGNKKKSAAKKAWVPAPATAPAPAPAAASAPAQAAAASPSPAAAAPAAAGGEEDGGGGWLGWFTGRS